MVPFQYPFYSKQRFVTFVADTLYTMTIYTRIFTCLYCRKYLYYLECIRRMTQVSTSNELQLQNEHQICCLLEAASSTLAVKQQERKLAAPVISRDKPLNIQMRIQIHADLQEIEPIYGRSTKHTCKLMEHRLQKRRGTNKQLEFQSTRRESMVL